jgi:hypothetical protein
MSLAPVPAEPQGASCANCSAALAPDQRYCLACGQPVSPVRLAFLDVLQGDAHLGGPGQAPAGAVPAGYATVIEPASGANGWMRRYAGLFGLLSVLLMAIIVGLLVGHWITQNNKAPAGPQVVKVEGLAAAAPQTAAATSTPATTKTTAKKAAPPAESASAKAAATKKVEAAEVKEAKAIEKTPPPKAVKINSTKLKKLGSTTGKKHEEEINSLGAQPIETGG